MMIREDVELHRAQRAFRSVLGAFARPGTVQSIELAPGNPARPAALDAASLVISLPYNSSAKARHTARPAASARASRAASPRAEREVRTTSGMP